jgi:hypothetical protein
MIRMAGLRRTGEANKGGGGGELKVHSDGSLRREKEVIEREARLSCERSSGLWGGLRGSQ